jgi:hypothetical protein
MNTLLLKYSLAVLTFSMPITSCKKSETLEKKGVINLDVLYTCNACQGSSYDIKFSNDTLVYHIGNDLTQFGITPSANFPVNVTVNSTPAGGNFVNITALEIIN